MREEAHIFDCAGERLVSIIHKPDKPHRRAVLIVVGGPQYRIGSHRYFVKLARSLAQAGHPVMRFDYRGMGDSEGAPRGFEHIEDDIEKAVTAFMEQQAGIEEVVLWGLCDAASAAAFYAANDPRIHGIVLLNPWVHQEDSYEEMLVRKYYIRRLFDKQFWKNSLQGKTRFSDFPQHLWAVLKRKISGQSNSAASMSLAERIAKGLADFSGKILLITSGNDLTAKEFEQEINRVADWKRIKTRPGFSHHHIDKADHTFSEGDSAITVTATTLGWLNEEK